MVWTDHVSPLPELVPHPTESPRFGPTAGAPVDNAPVDNASVDNASIDSTATTVPPIISEPTPDDSAEQAQAQAQAHAQIQAQADAEAQGILAPPPPSPRLAPVSRYDWGREEDKHDNNPRWTARVEPPEYRPIASRWGTVSVWLIAFAPWWSMIAFYAVLLVADRAVWLQWAALALPWLITIACAQRDIKRLQIWGHRVVPSWTWALLGAPGYLIARTVVLRKNTGIGSAPLWVWLANVIIVGGLIAFAILFLAMFFAGMTF